MSQNNSDQENDIEEPIFASISNEINKFKKPQLILELNKRNLKKCRNSGGIKE